MSKEKKPAASAPNVQALSVNASSFVSVKLSGRLNYKIWKAQMLCLINSQALIDIIKTKNLPPEYKKYDHLVKGWIFGSIDVKVLEGFVDLGTAYEVWTKLEVLSNIPDKEPKKQTSSTESFRGKVVSNFLQENLSGLNNYNRWKDQMRSLIETVNLLHIIDADHPLTNEKDVKNILEDDKRVKDLIKRNMNEELYTNHFKDLNSARGVWG